jgi:small ligand-binding sensory domain FIST
MEWASAVSERVDTREAVREAAIALRADRARPPDLVLAFVSPHHAANYARVAGWVYEYLQPGTFAGCSAAGVIGGGRELENREALSLTAAWLPDTKVCLAYLEHTPEAPEAIWPALLETPSPDEVSALITLVDPYSFDAESLLEGLDRVYPGTSKLGGLVSGGAENRAPALFTGDDVHREGALVLALTGDWDLKTIVAQGCRPVGEPYIVTRARGNVIRELNAGKPAEVLRRVYDNMNARDHSLFNTSLFLGIDMGDQRSRYGAGDFLIRNVLGIDPDSGAMAIDARVRDYQVVQFHLRDNEASAHDLTQRLRALTTAQSPESIRGALLFSCLGRGERLYGIPNHDSDAFAQRVSPASLSGFFGNGEIGPVGPRTYLHGYTSVFAVFCDRTR